MTFFKLIGILGYQISNNRDLSFHCLDQTQTMNDPYLSHTETSYRHVLTPFFD